MNAADLEKEFMPLSPVDGAAELILRPSDTCALIARATAHQILVSGLDGVRLSANGHVTLDLSWVYDAQGSNIAEAVTVTRSNAAAEAFVKNAARDGIIGFAIVLADSPGT